MGHPPDDCGAHGPEGWTYHDELGRPLIDEKKFPDMKAMTALGHSLDLTVGWCAIRYVSGFLVHSQQNLVVTRGRAAQLRQVSQQLPMP